MTEALVEEGHLAIQKVQLELGEHGLQGGHRDEAVGGTRLQVHTAITVLQVTYDTLTVHRLAKTAQKFNTTIIVFQPKYNTQIRNFKIDQLQHQTMYFSNI